VLLYNREETGHSLQENIEARRCCLTLQSYAPFIVRTFCWICVAWTVDAARSLQLQHDVQWALWRSEHKCCRFGREDNYYIRLRFSAHLCFFHALFYPSFHWFSSFLFFIYLLSALHYFLSEALGFHGVECRHYALSAVSVFCDMMSRSLILDRNFEAAGSSETLVPLYATTRKIPQAAASIFLLHYFFLITRIPVLCI
jgi:hypothetical protein